MKLFNTEKELTLTAVRVNPQRAFTLIELLVVIAIIGLLSSGVLASLSGARESAKITRMASDLRQIETAMTLWMDSENRTLWPTESELGGPGLSLQDVADNSSFGDYINNTTFEPQFGDFYGEKAYQYNNVPGVSSCSAGGETYYGVSIYVYNVPDKVREQLNNIIDGGNEANPFICGKLRLYGNGYEAMYYMLSEDGTL